MPPVLNGLDISNYTQSVDMAKIAAAYDVLIIKATEGAGSDLDNPFFAGPQRKDWQAARDAGIVRGAYHLFYCRPGSSTAQAQADHFLSVVTDFQKDDLAPIIDLEPGRSFSGLTDPKVGVAAVLQWLDIVKKKLKDTTGKSIVPFIYANPSVINDELANPAEFGEYPLYLANYAEVPSAPAPWSNDDIVIWQYAESKPIAGAVDDCDYCHVTAFRLGSTGKGVRLIQQLFIAKALLPAGSDDGDFGPDTEAAVRKFQTSAQLGVDGVVGIRTWTALQWA